MASSGGSTYSDSASGFIDISKYFSGSAEIHESCNSIIDSTRRYENENPRIPPKVFHNEKTKVQPFVSKQSKNVRHAKQFIGHSFKVGSSKK